MVRRHRLKAHKDTSFATVRKALTQRDDELGLGLERLKSSGAAGAEEGRVKDSSFCSTSSVSAIPFVIERDRPPGDTSRCNIINGARSSLGKTWQLSAATVDREGE